MAVRFEPHAEPIPGYRLIDRLGSGGFGEVWKCEAPGGIFKAIKIIHGDLRSQDNDLVRYAEQELKAMKRVKSVRHPYLIAIDRYDIVEGRLLIVMELADCNLWDRFRECRLKGLPGIPREELLRYMAESAEVLDLMNDDFQLQHLDIKPQNLFMLYNHVKVADFGQVKDLEGHMASVTGGITPVYAAPETFDGFVSRFCDQYSLACVYQELLTGTRPFDGGSMQQLLMQHLQYPPNLQPSPAADRPALARALAKKPQDRFPNIHSLVKALRGGTPVAVAVPAGVPTDPAAAGMPPVTMYPSREDVILAGDAPPTDTPIPSGVADTQPPRPAPPEKTGPGCVRPAVVIGLGASGLFVLQRLRRQLTDRYGPPDKTPAVRFLYIDTDPDALAAAAEGPAGLRPDEIFAARLNRPGHYLKPRLSGRSLIEGWFDPQILHRLPRTPVTMGLRPLGRLAFCDHYRVVMQKVAAELDAARDADGLAATAAAAGQSLRTNRPRVYVVAGLAGATGGGMFLDVAYAVRAKLRGMGYAAPDVAGVFFLPPDGPADEIGAATQANAYAALVELNHYARPDTVFQAQYDDRHGGVRDPFPPFTQTVFLSGPVATTVALTPVGAGPGRRSGPVGRTTRGDGSGPHAALAQKSARPGPAGADPFAAAADYLRADLFTPVGRAADDRRPAAPAGSGPVTVRAVGVGKYDWPRAEVVGRTARTIAGVVLTHWVTPNFGRPRDAVPAWAAALCGRLGIDADGLAARLAAAADPVAGGSVEAFISGLVDPLVPKGWRPRPPDANQLNYVFTQFDRVLGAAVVGGARLLSPVEEAVKAAGTDVGVAAVSELTGIIPALVDDPAFRMAGAEEAARHLVAVFDRGAVAFAGRAEKYEKTARKAYEFLVAGTHAKAARTATPADLAAALQEYPRSRFSAAVHRRGADVYAHLHGVLVAILGDVSAGRQRLDALHKALVAELETPCPPPGPRQVMPPGCRTVEDAAQKFLEVLADDDLAEIETRIQSAVEAEAGGLYQACLNTAGGAERLLAVLREETRAYLDARMGDVDLAGMFDARYGGPTAVAHVLRQAFADAVPAVVGVGPWAKAAVAVMAAPAGEGGDPLRRIAGRAVPADTPVAVADGRDEILIYREYAHVPLAVLPQLGPAWATAYQNAADLLQCSPHARADVPDWIGVDAE